MPLDDIWRADVAACGVKGRGVNFLPFCTVNVFNLNPLSELSADTIRVPAGKHN